MSSRQRCHSASTESLISIIYHNSYEDVSDASSGFLSENENIQDENAVKSNVQRNNQRATFQTADNIINNSQLNAPKNASIFCKRIIARKADFLGPTSLIHPLYSTEIIQTPLTRPTRPDRRHLGSAPSSNKFTQDSQNAIQYKRKVCKLKSSKNESLVPKPIIDNKTVKKKSPTKQNSSSTDERNKTRQTTRKTSSNCWENERKASLNEENNNDYSKDSFCSTENADEMNNTRGDKEVATETFDVEIDEPTLKSCDKESEPLQNCNGMIEESEKSSSTPKSPSQMTSWEIWLINKEKQLRKQRLSKKMEEDKLKKEQTKKELEKAKKLELSNIKIQEWIAKKDENDRKIKAREKERATEKLKEDQIQQDEKMKKSSKKIVQWKLAKQEQEKQKVLSVQQAKEKEDFERKVRKHNAEKSFEKWKKEKLSNRSQRNSEFLPYSFGFSGGKLTGYYDKSSKPPPSFFNPNPWIGPLQYEKRKKLKFKNVDYNSDDSLSIAKWEEFMKESSLNNIKMSNDDLHKSKSSSFQSLFSTARN